MGDVSVEFARRHERLRVWLWRAGLSTVLLIALLIVLVAVTPMLLGTPPGRRILIGLVNGQIAGTIDAQDVRLAWFGGQSLSDVVIRDPDDQLVATIHSIDAHDARLVSLLMGSRDFGRIHIRGDEAHLRQVAGEPTNLERTFATTDATTDAPSTDDPSADEPPRSRDAESEDDASPLQDLSMQLQVTFGRVTYESPDLDPVELTEVNAEAIIPNLRDIRVRFHSNAHQGGEFGRIDADVTMINGFRNGGELSLDTATLRGQAEITLLPVGLIDRITSQRGRLITLLGDQLSASIRTNGELAGGTAQIAVRSPNLEVDAAFESDGEYLHLASDARAMLRVTPQTVAAFTASDISDSDTSDTGDAGDEPSATLLEPTRLVLRLSDLALPCTGEGVTLDGARIAGKLTADDLLIETPEQGQVALRQAVITARSTSLLDRIDTQLTGIAELAGQSESVAADLVLVDLFQDDAPMQATLRTRSFPVVLADASAGQEGRLVRLLGQTLDADVDLAQGDDQRMTIRGRITSSNLTGPFEAMYGPAGDLSLHTPQPLQLVLSPEAFADWTTPQTGEPPRVALVESQPIGINVEAFRLTHRADDPSQIDASASRLVATLTIPAATFVDTQTRERVQVEEGAVRVDAPTLEQAIELLADFRLNRPGDAEAGQVHSRTQVRHLVSPSGQLQVDQAEISSDTTLTGVPSVLLDSLLRQGGSLAAVLGPTTSGQATVRYQRGMPGQASVQLDADGSRGSMVADISADGVVRLRESATFAMAVTPEMSGVFLKSVNPLLVQALGSDEPITLTVEQEGFDVPLSELDMSAISAAATLDLGTLRMDNGGLLRLVMRTLRRTEPGQLVASFTPLDVTLADGQLRYNNMTMTVGNVVMGFAGRVDLNRDQVNLTMSIPGSAMRKIFQDLEDVIPDEYVLNVPMRGPIDDPSIDTAAVTAELAKLALRKNLGGPEAGAVGGLIDALLGGSRQRQDD